MQLNEVSAVLRPRRHWEAIDLGLAMTRRWWWAIYLPWLVTLTGLLTLLMPLLWWQTDLAFILLWWLKPLLDRVPLYVVSRALFGAVPSPATTLKAIPSLLRRQSLVALTWLRFDPRRSFHLPVTQLEGLQGRARRDRYRILNQGGAGASWLTLVFIHFDIGLQLALLGFLGMLFPEYFSVDWFDADRLETTTTTAEHISFLLALWLALAILEPFYVAAGFALYLNRRTCLEAWDLEIGFRRLAQRLSGSGTTTALAILVTTVTLIAVTPAPVAAASNETASKPKMSAECARLDAEQQRLEKAPSAAKQALAEVLKSEPFPRCEPQSNWFFADDIQHFDGSAPALAELIRFLLWAILLLCCGYALYWLLRHYRPRPLSREPAQTPPPKEHIGGQLKPLPRYDDDVPEQCLQLWRDGQQRDAIGLLYRASLARLHSQHGLDYADSATESECLAVAERQLQHPELRQYLRRLWHSWQRLAYAHRAPADSEVQILCEQWATFFNRGQQS